MNMVFISVALGIFGAAFGSFAGAQVWRLRAKQLFEDKEAGRDVDPSEYTRLRRLAQQKFLSDRSIDLDTGQQLPWYDMIPIVSWIVLRGKSRFSGKPIGYFEIVMEVGMALFFVISFLCWPAPLDTAIGVSAFIIWLAAGVLLGIQFATDYKWSLLWTLVGYGVIGLGIVFSGLTVFGADDTIHALWSVAGAVMILGGLYFFLYVISRERWVGFGDVILGVGLGLLLADWTVALVALFMANLIGSIVVMVGFAIKKVHRGQHVPFGPFFIAGAIVAQLFGRAIIEWYTSGFLV